MPLKPRGYSDEIAILLSMDSGGFIKGVKLIDHNETPSYMSTILASKLLDSFFERNINDDFSDIETISGATISSKSIIDDIRSSSKKIDKDLYGIEIKEEKRSSPLKFLVNPKKRIKKSKRPR